MGLIKEMEQTAEFIGDHPTFSSSISLCSYIFFIFTLLCLVHEIYIIQG